MFLDDGKMHCLSKEILLVVYLKKILNLTWKFNTKARLKNCQGEERGGTALKIGKKGIFKYDDG